MEVCKLLLGAGADARIKNRAGKTAAELIPDMNSDEGRELYKYFKKQEEERVELEMSFKRAHVEDTNSYSDDEDDDVEKDEEEVRRRDKYDDEGDNDDEEEAAADG
jgi:hypothetical protein